MTHSRSITAGDVLLTERPTEASASREAATATEPLLNQIHSPEDLRKLNEESLPQLCSELRQSLIDVVSGVGGHFASSLGTVELTVALHYVFNTPHDRLVWDTGHQGYIHKMLTGRREKLHTVRQLGGLSGFLNRNESPFDAFGAGHAGTSISAAAGMLEGSSHGLDGDKQREVVAIIGDGSMTSGMAFEALNHAGQLNRRLIVVLNDNEMSIAPNVGAMSWGFSKAISGRFSNFARRHFKSLHEKGLIPHTFYRAIDRAEEAAQGFFSTPAMLFGSLGFRYLGPVDGHNTGQLVDALRRAKEQDGPVLIHALTVKGKGYDPAEADPVKYHGVTPFCAANGEFPKKAPAKAPQFTNVFGEMLLELCKNDPRVVAITAAMPDGTGTKVLAGSMPQRFYDVGIAEQHAVTFAAGLACEGLRPICAIYSTFLQRAYDQVLHDVAIQRLPVIFAMDRAGLVGADGATHHGVFDIAYLRSIPNFTLLAPADDQELREMLELALQHADGPIAIRYPRGEAPQFAREARTPVRAIGKGELLIDERLNGAKHVTLLALGNTVPFALDAAKILMADDALGASVVNVRSIKPLDTELLDSVCCNTDLIVTIEDHSIVGGFGSAVTEHFSESVTNRLPTIIRLGVPDHFIEHGTQSELYRLCGFDTPGIVSAVRNKLARIQHEGEAQPVRHQSVA